MTQHLLNYFRVGQASRGGTKKGGTAVYPYRGTPGEGLRSSYGVLSGRGDGGATVLAAGEHALGLALHLPDALAGDPQLFA